MKKLIFLLLILFIGIFLFLIFFFRNNSKTAPGSLPTPTLLQQNPKGAVSGVKRTQEEKQKDMKSFAVGNLLINLPHSEKDFSLYYSYKDLVFTLYINPLNKAAGNQEFDNYLKKNGVLDRSWIDNLFITYVSPTPTPGP